MKIKTYIALMAVWICALIGCMQHQEQHDLMKYPRKSVATPERKSGPAMIFYEAAEKDADVHNVIVTPPVEE